MTVTDWRKASYSSGNGGNCVEVGQAGSAVAVRDTKDRGGVTLDVPASAWRAFSASLKALPRKARKSHPAG